MDNSVATCEMTPGEVYRHPPLFRAGVRDREQRPVNIIARHRLFPESMGSHMGAAPDRSGTEDFMVTDPRGHSSRPARPVSGQGHAQDRDRRDECVDTTRAL